MRIQVADLSHPYYTEGGLVLGLQAIPAPGRWEVEVVAKPGRSQSSVSKHCEVTGWLPFLLLKP